MVRRIVQYVVTMVIAMVCVSQIVARVPLESLKLGLDWVKAAESEVVEQDGFLQYPVGVISEIEMPADRLRALLGLQETATQQAAEAWYKIVTYLFDKTDTNATSLVQQRRMIIDDAFKQMMALKMRTQPASSSFQDHVFKIEFGMVLEENASADFVAQIKQIMQNLAKAEQKIGMVAVAVAQKSPERKETADSGDQDRKKTAYVQQLNQAVELLTKSYSIAENLQGTIERIEPSSERNAAAHRHLEILNEQLIELSRMPLTEVILQDFEKSKPIFDNVVMAFRTALQSFASFASRIERIRGREEIAKLMPVFAGASVLLWEPSPLLKPGVWEALCRVSKENAARTNWKKDWGKKVTRVVETAGAAVMSAIRAVTPLSETKFSTDWYFQWTYDPKIQNVKAQVGEQYYSLESEGLEKTAYSALAEAADRNYPCKLRELVGLSEDTSLRTVVDWYELLMFMCENDVEKVFPIPKTSVLEFLKVTSPNAFESKELELHKKSWSRLLQYVYEGLVLEVAPGKTDVQFRSTITLSADDRAVAVDRPLVKSMQEFYSTVVGSFNLPETTVILLPHPAVYRAADFPATPVGIVQKAFESWKATEIKNDADRDLTRFQGLGKSSYAKKVTTSGKGHDFYFRWFFNKNGAVVAEANANDVWGFEKTLTAAKLAAAKK